jgi:hypothetical protein
MSLEGWKLALGIIPLLAAVLTGYCGVQQYRETREEQFRQRFWEEQLRIYARALDATSTIASAASLEEANEARQQFWRLYWGEMSLLESKSVERAMIAFGDLLRMCEAAGRCDQAQDLRAVSYHLAHCARESLIETWNPAGLSGPTPPCPYRAEQAGSASANP